MSSSEFPLRLATEPVVCAGLEDIARAGARRVAKLNALERAQAISIVQQHAQQQQAIL